MTALYNGDLSKVNTIELMFERRKIMRFIFLFTAIGFSLAYASVLRADDIYVNKDLGDDKNNGKPTTDATANSGPVRTIRRALQIAQRGDRIYIEKTLTPYYECLTLQGTRNSGTDYLPFMILSNGATLDGTSNIDPRNWRHVNGNVFRFMPALKSFQQLYLDGKPLKRVHGENRSVIPQLDPEQWALAGGWVYFCTDTNRIPTQYDLRFCKHQTGITLYEVNNVVIDGLIIQGFQLDGLNAHDAVSKTEVRNCKLRGNGRSGLSAGGASRIEINTSVIGANGEAQIRSEGHCRLGIRDCRLLESENSGPAFLQDGGHISVDGKEYSAALPARQPSPEASSVSLNLVLVR